MLRTSETIIRKPIVLTEKSSRLREGNNKVIFEVAPTANKIEIKKRRTRSRSRTPSRSSSP